MKRRPHDAAGDRQRQRPPVFRRRLQELAAAGLGFLLLLPLGCREKSGYTFREPQDADQPRKVEEVLQSQLAQASETAAATAPLRPEELAANNPSLLEQPQEASMPPKTPGVDVDLSVMSGNMAFSQLFCMLQAPADYIGKTVKMHGLLSFYRDGQSGQPYYYCVIKDTPGCCAQGLEFLPADLSRCPEGFPENMQEISLSGIFEQYTAADGNRYCRLKDAEILNN